MSQNSAAWLNSEKEWPFEVKASPDWTPSENEILVKNHAIAINPIDGYIQTLAIFQLKYPVILGQDLAGEVVSVGPNVTRFKKGDRVLGHALGITVKNNRDGAFQAYTIVQTQMATKIPDDMAYENAVVVPLGLSTAASALFREKPFLQLQYPSDPAQKPTGKTVIIWGGSSSVGCNAIQLSIAAGYEVISTASPKNFDLLKRLGASHVFDYNSPTVITDIQNVCTGKDIAGALDCIGYSAMEACMSIMQKVHGSRAVVSVKPVPDKVLEGVTAQFVNGGLIKDSAVAPAIHEDFLTKALKSGNFVAAPEPRIVGKGLESVQTAVDLIQKGVSASKLVVSL